MSRTQVYEWTEKFMNGVTSMEVSPRPGPAFTAVTEDNIAAVESVIRENRRSCCDAAASAHVAQKWSDVLCTHKIRVSKSAEKRRREQRLVCERRGFVREQIG
jgi:hypothetical protein